MAKRETKKQKAAQMRRDRASKGNGRGKRRQNICMTVCRTEDGRFKPCG